MGSDTTALFLPQRVSGQLDTFFEVPRCIAQYTAALVSVRVVDFAETELPGALPCAR